MILDCCHSGTGTKEVFVGEEDVPIIKEGHLPEGMEIQLDSTSLEAQTRGVEEDNKEAFAQAVVIFIDCCYSGSIPISTTSVKSITSPGLTTKTSVTHRLAGSGRVVIAACDTGEVAHEISSLKHGLFTHYLLEGISTAADQNQDGEVQLVSELYPYLYRKVIQESRNFNVVQTPVLDGKIRGDICLVRVLSSQNRSVK